MKGSMKSLLWACLLLVLDDITSINAQACSPEGSVQLEGLFSSVAGRVELCQDGVWGTVCGDSTTAPWSEKNAQVVCLQMGFSGALNSILPDSNLIASFPDSTPQLFIDKKLGSGVWERGFNLKYFTRLQLVSSVPAGTPIHIRRVACLGHEESLESCPHVDNNDTCSHEQDVAITCRSGTIADGDVLLVGDERNGYGAVQLRDFTVGFIGICPNDGSFGETEAGVVCRQLGYDSGTPTDLSDDFGTFFQFARAESFSCDSDSILLSRLSPTCNYVLTSQCSTSRLVGVACERSTLPDGSIRLFGGADSREGRVEILFNGRWGRICSTLWDTIDGEVACRELGFGTDSVSIPTVDSFPGESNDIQPIWLGRVECLSNSESLNDCVHLEPTGFADCYNSFNTFALLDCGDPSSSAGLSSGAITGIVFAVIFIAFFVVPFGWAYGKEYWENRERYALYRCLVWPYRQCNRCLDRAPWNTSTTRQAPISRPATTPVTVAMADRPRRPSTSSSESEPEPEREEQERPELIKAPPPSYRAASNFPAADPTDLPPPYPGPPQPADAGYPTAPGAYPPPTGGAAYPPTSPGAYPPPTGSATYPPTSPEAYPPPTGDAAYPPAGPGAYPPGGDLAYPPATAPGADLQGYPAPTLAATTYPPTLELAYPPATATAPAPYPVETALQQAPIDPILAAELSHAPGSLPGELPYPPDNQQSS